jgi:hypothetical protein
MNFDRSTSRKINWPKPKIWSSRAESFKAKHTFVLGFQTLSCMLARLFLTPIWGCRLCTPNPNVGQITTTSVAPRVMQFTLTTFSSGLEHTTAKAFRPLQYQDGNFYLLWQRSEPLAWSTCEHFTLRVFDHQVTGFIPLHGTVPTW